MEDNSKLFSCEIKRPSSTKERMSEGIFSFKFFTLFLNVFMIGAMYIAEMIGESAEP